MLSGPILVNNCHCRLCQKQTGTGSAVNAVIETDRLEHLVGELTAHELATGSGGVQRVLRCASCGTAVWSHYPRLGARAAFVRVGTLDDSSAVSLDAAIFTSEKPDWAPLPSGAPSFETTYVAADLLSAVQLARLHDLLPPKP
jgi:hypothetical protein